MHKNKIRSLIEKFSSRNKIITLGIYEEERLLALHLINVRFSIYLLFKSDDYFYDKICTRDIEPANKRSISVPLELKN